MSRAGCHCRSRQPPEEAFTLSEVLVASAVSLLILGVLAAGTSRFLERSLASREQLRSWRSLWRAVEELERDGRARLQPPSRTETESARLVIRESSIELGPFDHWTGLRVTHLWTRTVTAWRWERVWKTDLGPKRELLLEGLHVELPELPELPYESSRFLALPDSVQPEERGARWFQAELRGVAVWWYPPPGLEAAPRRELIHEWIASGFAVAGPPPEWRGGGALLELSPPAVTLLLLDPERALQLRVNLSP
ncbi:MAG: hypothetical protein V3T77_02800 [Planctomycetota bacterium]